MKTNSLILVFKALVVVAVGVLGGSWVVGTSRAADASWAANAAGTYDWTNAANWSPGVPGATSGITNVDVATFGNKTGAQTVTVDSGRNIGGINFNGNANAYTLSGNAILLSSGGTIQSSGAASAVNTISSEISIQGDNGAATFSAGSSSSGYLSISGAVTGASTSGNTTALTLNGSNTYANIIGGVISDGSGGGKLSLVKSGTGLWTLGAANTFTGGLQVNQGTLVTGASGKFAASGSTIYLGSDDTNSTAAAELRQGNLNDGNTYSIIVRSTEKTAATRTLASAVAGTRVLNADVQIGDGTGSINLLNLGNYIDLRGTISQSGGNPGSILVKANNEARLGGASNNTYTGSTTVENGTLILSKSGTAIAIPGDLNIGTATSAAAAVVRLDGSSGNGSAQLASNSIVTFSGTNATKLHINNGQSTTLNLAGLNSASGVDARIGAANDGNSYTHTLKLTGSGTYSYAGIIANSHDGGSTSRKLALTKTGSGTQELAGTNTYTGATTVNAGTLVLSGSILGSATTVTNATLSISSSGQAGTVTINGGGKLTGSGAAGATTIASGGELAPGNNGPGTLTFSNGLTLVGGSILDFYLGTGGNSLVSLTGGTLSVSGMDPIILNITESGVFGAGTYTLFQVTGGGSNAISSPGSSFAMGSEPGGFNYSFVRNGSNIDLQVTAIPEPMTANLVLCCAILVAALRIRRRT